jgi:hypothetical protein
LLSSWWLRQWPFPKVGAWGLATTRDRSQVCFEAAEFDRGRWFLWIQPWNWQLGLWCARIGLEGSVF